MCQPLPAPEQLTSSLSSSTSSPSSQATSSSSSRTLKNSPPATSGASSPAAPPLPLRSIPLQFISSNPDGTIPNPRAVRVHAITEYHARKREARRVGVEKVGAQRRSKLKPRAGGSAVDADAAVPGLRKLESKESKELGIEAEVVEGAEAAQEGVALRRRDAVLSPSATVQYSADFPYAWFESAGPVLYVNRSKWPFQTPFHVTGSDRNDRSIKSLTPRQSHWMPYMRISDSTVVKGAVLDQNVLSWIGQTTELFQFRGETIRWIQEQLNHPVGKGSNATIGAIMTFTMWTSGNGNSKELITHMDAIERIVNLRGGFLSFQSDGAMTAKLVSFDSIIAVLTGQPTRFPQVSYFVSHPITPAAASNAFHHESPLFGTGKFEATITYPKDQTDIIVLLKRMWKLTLDFEYHHLNGNDNQLNDGSTASPNLIGVDAISPHLPSQTVPVIPFSQDPQSDYKIPLLTLPLLTACADANCEASHNHVLDTLKYAAQIYVRTLASAFPSTKCKIEPIDFPSPLNGPAFTSLCASFGTCTTSDFWLRYPGLLIWVLLVGTAASRDKRECSWWMFYISRLGSFSSAERWEVGMEGVRRFLELQSILRTVHEKGEDS